MSVSWCSSTDPENWPHCRHTGLSELRLRPCSHISNVWSNSHMLLNWFIVKLYHMPLILLNGPFFTFLSKCASIVFSYLWLHLHSYWFICILQHFKLIKWNQLSIFDYTFNRHFLWWFWYCLQHYQPQRAHLAQQTYWNLNAECLFRGQ